MCTNSETTARKNTDTVTDTAANATVQWLDSALAIAMHWIVC